MSARMQAKFGASEKHFLKKARLLTANKQYERKFTKRSYGS